MIYPATLQNVVKNWGLVFKRVRPDIPMAGSPERCLSRTVIEDDCGRLYVVENLPHASLPRKVEIAEVLDRLSEKGLSCIQPCRRNNEGRYILSLGNRHWQVIPFVPGIELNRPDYVFDGWRGCVLADFLIELRDKSNGIPCGNRANPFSIKNFIHDLRKRIRTHNPELIPRIDPAISWLENEFMAVHDTLPVSFSHGDYHPVNVIWSKDRVNCVIDWEFCGYKPEIYDPAILMGCIGAEDPQSLTGPLIHEFLLRIVKEAGCYSTLSLKYLLEFIVAVRFAWLSEWLRKSDAEMVELELDYLHLLTNESRFLKKAWDLPDG
jgi:homoserine kinase type II